MEMIKAEKLSFSRQGNGAYSLEDISFSIEEGDFVVFLGGSGSGKTSLAMHLNALHVPQRGSVSVAGLDCAQAENAWEIRKKCGVVFESIDSHFVSTYAYEDLAFGPRNFLMDEAEIPAKIEAACKLVGINDYETCSTQLLSAIKKKKLAIASVLASDPDIVVFDDPFAPFEGNEAQELAGIIKAVHEMGKTVVVMTNDPEQAAGADRVFLMHKGKIAAQGTAREILSDKALLESVSIHPPFAAQVYNDLLDAGVKLERCPLDLKELVEEVCR